MGDEWNGEANIRTSSVLKNGGMESDTDAKFRAKTYLDKEICAGMAGRIAEGHAVGHGRYFAEVAKYDFTPDKGSDNGLGDAMSMGSNILGLLKGLIL